MKKFILSLGIFISVSSFVQSQNLYVGYPIPNQILNLNSGSYTYDTVFVLNNGTLNILNQTELIVNDLIAVIHTGKMNVSSSNLKISNILSIQHNAEVNISDTVNLLFNIILKQNAVLNIDSAFIDMPLNYITQYHWYGRDNSLLNITNSTFNFLSGSIEIALTDTAEIIQLNNQYTSAITPLIYSLSGSSNVNVDSCLGVMEMVISENTSVHLKDSYPFIMWYMFKDGDSIVYNYPPPNSTIFPEASNISNYLFSNQLPDVSGVDYTIDITNCDGVYWGVIPKENTNITINNSLLIACGFYFSDTSVNTAVGLVNSQLYTSYTAPLSDRTFSLNNSTVKAWNFYPSDTVQLIIDSCIFGEVMAFSYATVDIYNSTCDGTGGHFSVGNNSKISVYNSDIIRTTALNNSIVVCREDGKTWFYNSNISGKITVSNNGTLILGNTTFSDTPLVYDSGCFAEAWVDSISNGLINSSISITGKIWKINGAANNSKITRYIVEYSLPDSTGFTLIKDTSAISFNIMDSELSDWNSQGLFTGDYLLWLTIFVDGDTAISCNRAVTLINNTNVDENIIPENIYVYPNPTDGLITINGDNILSIKIYNTEGKEVYKGTTSIVNLKEYQEGTYFVKIETKVGVFIKKLILY